MVSFSMDPSLSGYDGQKAVDILDRVSAGIGAIPGVRSVALTDNSLLTGNVSIASVNIEGYQRKEDESMNPDFAHVRPGYFKALGARLISGREFTDADRPDTQKVAVINDAFASRFFPKENPIGRRIGMGRA
jgi:hypothetical protein